MPRFSRPWLRLIALVVLALASSCQSSDVLTKAPVTVTIAGSTAMQPVLYALTSEFSRQHPHVFFDIAGGGSTIGEERVWQGQIDLAASTLISPTLPPPGLTPTARKLQRTPLGLDGIAVIVHPDNPLTDLTLLQLQELYSGRQWNWQSLGGDDTDVLLVTREAGSGARTLFDERVMGKLPTALTAVVISTSAEVVDFVAKSPTAIGYVSRAYVIDQLPTATVAPPRVAIVAIEQQLPTTEALHAQSYHLIQPLYLVSRQQPPEWVRQFIDFALSPQGQAIVAHYHLPLRSR